MNYDLTLWRESLNKKIMEHDRQLSIFKEEGRALKDMEEQISFAEEARSIIQDVAKSLQQKAHEQISDIVSSGMNAIFDDENIFKIRFDKKRGRTEATFLFEKDEMELDPLSSSGGGLIDVAAFTLRVASIILSRSSARKILILDEPFKNVSKMRGYMERIPDLLQRIAKDLGIQIIMTTNFEELKIGKIVEVGR